MTLKRIEPFLHVADMTRSLAFYVGALGFRRAHAWPSDSIVRWCRIERDGAAMMLQTFSQNHRPNHEPESGMSLCLYCEDALEQYRAFLDKGVSMPKPFLGNGLWVVRVTDPDGYKLEFVSPADAPEETVYED